MLTSSDGVIKTPTIDGHTVDLPFSLSVPPCRRIFRVECRVRDDHHFAIVGDVFGRAGFTISLPKDQLGANVLALGFRLDLQRQRVAYPPEKRAVLLARIRELRSSKQAKRDLVESVVSVLGHLCTIVAEGRLQLATGYALLHAKRRSGGRSHVDSPVSLL